ncbi:MAG: DUF4349 domain-containing protein [Nocardioides sp.]
MRRVTPSMNTTTKRFAAGAAVVLMVALTSACSGGGGGMDTQTAEDSAGGQSGDLTFAEGGTRSSAGGDSASELNRAVVQVRSVIRTGEVAVTNDDLDAARSELDDLLAALGGTLDREQTEHDPDGEIERSTLVVRVPVDSFDAAMAGIAALGTVKHADTAAKDVTTEVIDVDERVETLETSLDRLQDYQRDARDIDDLIRYEQQITERESELQSLKAQQSYLTDQTSMSTISVYLSTPKKYVAPPGALEDAGFISGIKSGWSALVDTVVVVLTIVGAVLPFAAALALIGIPAWLLVRRLVRRPAPTAPAGTASSD